MAWDTTEGGLRRRLARGRDAALRLLPPRPSLRDFRPVPCVRLPEHHVPRAAIPAVDVHTHLGRWLAPRGDWLVRDVDAIVGVLDACNVRTLVNLDGRWGDELQANLARFDQAHPGRFVTFCQLDWREMRAKDGPGRLVSSLQRSVSAGARGLKVWKDLGRAVVDGAGGLVLPDDERLAPVWEAAGELAVPVLIHTADPVAFFRPTDRFNERLEELLENPGASWCSPRLPSFQRLMDAFEAMVAAHPATTFIAAHVLHAEDLASVSRLLSTYPNLAVDLSGRLSELGRQPRAARRFVLAHSERVLFGSDLMPPNAADYAIWFRFLETDDEHFPYSTAPFPHQGRWAVSGLDLPAEALAAVYRDNALRLVPGLADRAE